MIHHIKEHPIALLAALLGVILILSVTILALSHSNPSEEALPEAEASVPTDDTDLLRNPEGSLPEFSIETTWSCASEEPTMSALETSFQEEPFIDEVSAPEESFVPSMEESEPEPFEGYTLKVYVTNRSGNRLKGAEVTIGDSIGKTGSDGCFTATVEESEVHVRVSAPGFVSYNKTFTLSDDLTDVSVVLTKADGSVRSMLDALELRPYRTNMPELNAAAEKILNEITTPDMDTYDQVLACYDWVMEHMLYQRASHRARGYWACAYQAYKDGYGTCNCYTALFIVLTRYIGLETCYVEGDTAAYGGGMTFHYWTVLEMDGEYYVFDPQVEDQVIQRSSSKQVTHDRFCLKEPTAKYVYRHSMPRSACIKNFEAYLLENGSFIDP